MNKHDAHDYIPLLQALGDGKIIQYKNIVDNKWVDLETINFTYSAKYYRVKPEPRTFLLYIIEPNGTNGETLITTHPTSDSRWKQITVQEVLK